MLVGIVSLVNLSVADVFIYVNHSNPRSALHIAPIQPIDRSQVREDDYSPLPYDNFPKFHSAHILRSPDSFTFANMFGQDNTLIIEFDGIFYKYNIRICIEKHPIIQPMIMALHPQYISLTTKYGEDVWKSENNHLSQHIELIN